MAHRWDTSRGWRKPGLVFRPSYPGREPGDDGGGGAVGRHRTHHRLKKAKKYELAY